MSNSPDLLNGLLPFPVSFTTLAIAVVAILAAIACFRGVLRLMFGMIAVVAGTVAAYFTYQNAPMFFSSSQHVVFVSIAVGLIAFLFSYYLILGLIFRPFLGKHRGFAGGIGVVLSLIPAALLIWVLATGLRLSGTIMEMEQFGENVAAEEGAEVEKNWLANWRRALDNDALARLLAKIDPFVQQGQAVLTDLLITTRDESAPVEIAENDADAAAIMQNPTVQELGRDIELRKLVKAGEYVAVMQHPKVRAASRNPEIAKQLKSIDIHATAEKALYSTKSKDQPKVRKRIPNRLWRRKNPDPTEEAN